MYHPTKHVNDSYYFFSLNSPNILMCKQITEFFNDFNILHEEYFQMFGYTNLLLNLLVFFALKGSNGTVTGL